MRKTLSLLLIFVLVLFALPANAQRKTMKLGRGVVATFRSNVVNVNWRRLAQEPEDAKYNVYVDKTGNGSYLKLTSTPISLTNYQTTTSAIPYGSYVAVTLVDNQGNESVKSTPFHFVNNEWANAVIRINFNTAGSPLVEQADTTFSPKYCWPVDLDGDGEMEYVVNRVYNLKDQNGCYGWGADKLGGDCLEAYTRDGKHMWTVNLGLHFFAFGGQNDGVSVGDFDGDGKGEVMVQVCEGARFWDATNKKFGKYLYYNGVQASHTGSGTETVSSDGSDPDIDKDNITNYTWPAQGKNPQYYMAVIDGMTGAQKDVCPMTLPKDCTGMTYTRTNKGDFMGDEYSYLSGAMGAAFLDGVHQSAVIQFCNRRSSDGHHYFTYAYGYEGREFHEIFTFAFRDNGSPSEFHHIRIGDVDGDGKDEVMNGAYALDHDGKMLWNSGIGHGDRFRMSDIDPDRPGQEIFAIQQNAGDMLGMILYDATDGSSIKRWYMGSVGDVGRGECMDVDPNYKGYEMWSTMANMYNAKGEVINSSHPYPFEGMWWDDDLLRECAWSPGSGDNAALVIGKYNGSTGYTRQIQPSSESGWHSALETGIRPLFWGDILGDWREEIILDTRDDNNYWNGMVIYSTDYATTEDRIYCLLEDPNYFGQITNRGYYQSPNTSFYLGCDMPRPQLPPVMKADDETAVYDLTLGNATISAPASGIKNAYVMPVKNQTLTVNSEIGGDVNLWKSQPGTLVLNYPVTSTGKTIISQGTLEVNNTISGDVELRARGVLSGKGSVHSLSLEGALNYAEGVIRPTDVLTIDSDFKIDAPLYITIDIDKAAFLQVNGTLNLTDTLTFNIESSDLKEGTYPLIQCSAAFNGDVSNIGARGLVGHAYSIESDGNNLFLVIKGQRDPLDNVVWTGTQSNIWNYTDESWQVNEQGTTYVTNDGVVFGDNSSATTVNIPELVSPGSVNIDASQNYIFQGNGGLTGETSLTKNGVGKLTLSCKNSDYTGATIINEGTVVLKELSMQGSASSIGVGSTAPAKWKVGKATMIFDGASLATDRGINLTDTATFQIPTGYSTTIKGLINGSTAGVLKKTGTGQLSVSYYAANSWKSTILNAGTIALGTSTATLGGATSTVHVTGDSKIIQFYSTASSGATIFQNTLDIDSAKTLTFVGTGRGSFKSTLKGKGTIKLSSEYVRFDQYFNGANFYGTVSLGSGAGRITQNASLKNATLNIEDGVSVGGVSAGGSTATSYTSSIGAVTGTGTLSTGVWNIGYLGLTNNKFEGTFNSEATVNKYGDGALTLTGASAGALKICAGSVFANNTSASITTGTITVADGGLLTGCGQVQNVIVNKGGAIGAQSSVVSTVLTKTLTINGTLKVNAGGMVNVRYRSSADRTAYDAFAQTGAVTLISPVFNFSSTNGTEMLPGTEFKIFSGTGAITLTGDVTICPERPLDGYKWDTSRLASEGIITMVEDATDISTIAEDETETESMGTYDLNGRRINTIKSTGVYVIDGKKVYNKPY